MKKFSATMCTLLLLTALTSCNSENEESSKHELIYEENGISIFYEGFSDKDNGVGVDLLIENNSEQKYIIQTRDVYVNDFGVKAAFSPKVEAGKKLNYDIRIIDEELEKNSLSYDKIQTIEFKFHVSDDSFSDSFDSDVIMIDLKE